MEPVVLNTLKFNLTVVTPNVFLARFEMAVKASKKTSALGRVKYSTCVYGADDCAKDIEDVIALFGSV